MCDAAYLFLSFQYLSHDRRQFNGPSAVPILSLSFERLPFFITRHSPAGSRVTLSTIHSFCHYLLRNEGKTIEILSGKEQIVFMREVMKKQKVKDLSIGMVLSEISLAKNNMI
jgi:hypothetical protein